MARQIDRPTGSLEERCAAEAAAKIKKALGFPPGVERDQLLREARQLEIASKMEGWLTSPGLQSPT